MMELFVEGLRVWLAALFAYAGALKLVDSGGGKEVLTLSGVSHVFSDAIGMALPWLELSAAILVLSGHLYPLGPLMCSGLGLAFTGVAARALGAGVSVPCGCTGASSKERVTPATIARGAVMALGGVCLLAFPPAAFSVPALVAAMAALLPALLMVQARIRRARIRLENSAREDRLVKALVNLLERSGRPASRNLDAPIGVET